MARRAIATGVNQYSPGAGLPELRAAIAEQRKRDYQTDLDVDSEVLVTVGATEAIAAALLGHLAAVGAVERATSLTLALAALAYLRTTAPRKQLLYRKRVPTGSAIVVHHKKRGNPKLEIVKPK